MKPGSVAVNDGEDPLRLSDAVVESLAELRPVTASFWGIEGHDAEWDDLSPTGHERGRYEHEDHLSDLNSIASSFQYVRMVFDIMDTSSEQGCRARVSRLETLSGV